MEGMNVTTCRPPLEGPGASEAFDETLETFVDETSVSSSTVSAAALSSAATVSAAALSSAATVSSVSSASFSTFALRKRVDTRPDCPALLPRRRHRAQWPEDAELAHFAEEVEGAAEAAELAHFAEDVEDADFAEDAEDAEDADFAEDADLAEEAEEEAEGVEGAQQAGCRKKHGLYSMAPGCSSQAIRDIVSPVALSLFKQALEDGHVLNPTGTYTQDFDHAHEETCSTKIIYAHVCEETEKLLKTGYTGNFVQRKAKDREVGKVQATEEDFHWVPISLLDRLTKEMDVIVQKQFGKVMTDLCTSEQTPWQIKRVLEFVVTVNDGGAEIGMKKKMCNLLVEWGSQIYYKLSVPGELFMLDELKYKKREDRVKEANDILVEAIRQELDMDREIPVDCVTSWATAVDESKLCATKCIMEYILGCPVDLKDRDTIPYPNIPSAVTNEEAYSSDYSFGDIQFGLCRLDSMVEETPPNSILLLDSNGVLFNRKPGAMKDRMIHKHKYRTVTSVFGGAIDLLSHTDTRGVKKVSLRHGPPCHAVDSTQPNFNRRTGPTRT
jgi:hypothetical protein